MKKRNITILAIGDKRDYDSFRKFHKDRGLFLKSGFEYVNVSHKQVLAGRIPQIPTEKVIIFLFFPFYYWNKYIEHRHYKGVYGNMRFFRKFVGFCEKLGKIIKSELSDKKIFFVNKPLSCAIYRDKLAVKRRLSRADIPNPKLHKTTHIKEVESRLNKGENLFIKPQCGSMGKGITFLSWPNWQTNFAFKDNKIISKRSDKGWKFRDVTGNNAFLRQLLAKDIFIEKAIDTLIFDKKKVDLRLYTFFNKVLYIYPRKNHPDKVTTNITQGGKGDPALSRALPKHMIAKAKRLAERTSRSLGFNLAGVDIVMDRNLKDVYVVDVNAFPGFPKRRTFKLTPYMIRELVRRLNRGGLRFEKAL